MARFNCEISLTNSLTLNYASGSVTYEMKTSMTTVLFSLLIFADVLSAERDGKGLMLTFISMLVVVSPATHRLELKF